MSDEADKYFTNGIQYREVPLTGDQMFGVPIENGRPVPQHARMSYFTDNGNEEPLLKLFRFKHLPGPLGDISEKFMLMACWIVDSQPRSAERTLALRALWDAKNLAVVARVPDGV